MTAAEVAHALRWNVPEATAKRRLRAISPNHLPYHQVGRGRLYLMEDVHNYIKSRRVQ
jgi:hypothetical protein